MGGVPKEFIPKECPDCESEHIGILGCTWEMKDKRFIETVNFYCQDCGARINKEKINSAEPGAALHIFDR